MTVDEILKWFESNRSQYNIDGMRRFGIITDKAFGVSLKQIDILKKNIKKDNQLAIDLWETGYLETRHLAALVADPKTIQTDIIEKWVNDFDNWAICDSTCGKLIQKTPYVYDKIIEWQLNEKLYVKRSAFALIAWIAVHHKKIPDNHFNIYYDMIINHACDDRNYIKKAVNWALRQIGKRNINLANKSLIVCDKLREIYPTSKSAKWIASDAERELRNKFGLL